MLIFHLLWEKYKIQETTGLETVESLEKVSNLHDQSEV